MNVLHFIKPKRVFNNFLPDMGQKYAIQANSQASHIWNAGILYS